MKKDDYHVYYRSNATDHYIYLAKQSVEIVRNEARIELNGQLTRCIVEDVERVTSDRHALAGPGIPCNIDATCCPGTFTTRSPAALPLTALEKRQAPA